MSEKANLLAAFKALQGMLPPGVGVVPLGLRVIGAEAVSAWAAGGWQERVQGATRYEWELAVAVPVTEGNPEVAKWLDAGLTLQAGPPESPATAVIPDFVLAGWRCRSLPPADHPDVWTDRRFLPGWVLTLTILVPILYKDEAKRITDVCVDVRVPSVSDKPKLTDDEKRKLEEVEKRKREDDAKQKRIRTRTPVGNPHPDWDADWSDPPSAPAP